MRTLSHRELERALRREAALSEDAAVAATAALSRRADREGLVEVAYASMDSPIGTLLLAGTGRGLLRIGLPNVERDEFLVGLAEAVSPRVVELPGRLDAARHELEEYFGGSRRRFELELDARLIRAPFGAKVLDEIRRVPFGSAITYGEVAARAGSPRAHRAAGNALGSNPIPIVIPCHRVVRSGGAIGGYGGGPETKRFLLRHEGWLD